MTIRRSPVRWLLVALAVAALGAAAFGFAYLFLRPPAPAAVSLPSNPPAAATPSATTSTAPGTSPATSPVGGTGSLDGTWSIDPSVGSFSDFSGSFVGYRVQEELANIGAQEAVGRTPDVEGTLTLTGTQVTAVEITANLTSLQSDDGRRDGQLRQQGIETGQFPTATFRMTEPIELGSIPAEGETVSASATGELTLHGVTRPVTMQLQARLSGGTITVAGSVPILFADYGIERPRSMLVLSIADNGTMEFQLHLTRSGGDS
jgi:polyisoprenoid-binding protein YceI